MAEVIKMPKMSDTMEEGVISSWLVKEGDFVKSGDVLAEVETDKATMELESYEDGTLLHIGVKEKESVPVDGIIAIIGEKSEDITSLLTEMKGDTQQNLNQSSTQETQTVIDISSINATIITMPKMSDTMEEGTIVSWMKKEGDKVKTGDVLAEIETDKATMELEAYEDGVLLYVGVGEGNAVAVDGVLAVIGENNADYKKLLENYNNVPSANQSSTGEKQKQSNKPTEELNFSFSNNHSNQQFFSDNTNDRIKASPLAKKIALEKGLNLSEVTGSGDFGRIIKRDVESFVQTDSTSSKEADQQFNQLVFEQSYRDENVSQIRKTIAKRLSESKFAAPHFYLTMEINMDRIMEARNRMNQISDVKISVNDIVIKAVSSSLRKHPKLNSSWLGDKIRYNNHINVGVAVAVEEGLLVPVIRFADQKSIANISSEVKKMVKKAQNKELKPEDWQGNTFTISNLGMFGIEEFTAIINPPDSCILAVGGIKQAPIVVDGELKVGHVMKVTLSCDHRVVDGALGANFLKTLKLFLEDPMCLLI